LTIYDKTISRSHCWPDTKHPSTSKRTFSRGLQHLHFETHCVPSASQPLVQNSISSSSWNNSAHRKHSNNLFVKVMIDYELMTHTAVDTRILAIDNGACLYSPCQSVRLPSQSL